MNKKTCLSFIALFFVGLFISCSTEKTDEYLLEKDRKELNKNLYSTKVHTYKLGKICIRASIEKDTLTPEFKTFKSGLDRIFHTVVTESKGNPSNLSATDYISIYRDYKAMSGFIEKTDEDIFPTLTEALNVAYGDNNTGTLHLLKGNDKVKAQNMEHAVLSALVLFTSDLGKEVSLYECAKTNPDLLEAGEVTSLLRFFRGFIFLEKKLLYLSEQELTQNIDWLNKNKQIDLPLVQATLRLNINQPQTLLYYQSLNYLLRGLDRSLMERPIDEKRSMEDFQAFIDNSAKLGLNNELTWVAETYLYVKQEDHEKAITALTKLKSSNLIPAEDRKNIEVSIAYLQKREKGAMLNKVSDKYFLGKIVAKYMYRILETIDWEKLLEEHQVPHTRQIFATIRAFSNMEARVKKYTDGSSIKETGKDLQEKGEGLLNKTKDLFK